VTRLVATGGRRPRPVPSPGCRRHPNTRPTGPTLTT
jgi:hypothetical protein